MGAGGLSTSSTLLLSLLLDIGILLVVRPFVPFLNVCLTSSEDYTRETIPAEQNVLGGRGVEVA